MKFTATPLPGAVLIDMECHSDERGLFARTYCSQEFAAQGISMPVAQCNVSFNHLRGTVRGMHYQVDRAVEAKLVRCTRGAIYDVIVDLRRDSPTYGKWFGAELTSATRRALYIPPHLAHGFQTLEDESEVFYQMSAPYASQSGRGLRWNESRLNLHWPLPVSVISTRDASYDDFAW